MELILEPETQSLLNINRTKHSFLGSTVILQNASEPSADLINNPISVKWKI